MGELILADDRGFLAKGGASGFAVLRRLPVQAVLLPPADYRLSIMFMVSSPRGQTVLDYHTEGVAIELATGRIGVDLAVEESGDLAQLGETLAMTRGALKAMDIPHLSCHGLNELRPVLAEVGKDGGETEPVSTRMGCKTREEQTEDEAVAEDVAAFEDSTLTMIGVPNELVPAIRELLAKHHT